MGQPGIPTLNKTGYSMFWGSMWDNKNYYNRHFKEDIFLRRFFSLAFNDCLSLNVLNLNKKNLSKIKIHDQIVDLDKKSAHKYIISSNKIEYYQTKLWVLRYQKWLILYHYIYILNFNNFNFFLKKDELFPYKYNFSYILKFYKKINNKILLNFKLSKKIYISNIF